VSAEGKGHVDATVDVREQVLDELAAALAERESAQSRFEAAVGTSSEMRAYERLRKATRRVARADREARRSQSSTPVTAAPSTIL
jgi:hypothetical protein